MKEYIEKLPKEIKDLIFLARDLAAKNSTPAYLVGGFVRDLILGVENFDLDITIEGDGIKFAQEFAGHLKSKLICHHRFCTATIISPAHIKIDIASARKETYPAPAHLPVVSTGTLKDDLFRRDFTINAMALSLSMHDFGALVDFFGGKADLKDKKIRILHDLSFIDDPTRILRAVRFEQRFNFRIELKTLNFLRKAAALKMLEKVNPQRTRDDLILILKEARPWLQIRRLEKLTGFNFLNKHFVIKKDIYQLMRSASRVVGWFRKFHAHRRPLDVWLIYLMSLLDNLSLNNTEAFINNFAFRKGEKKRILSYKAINSKLVAVLNKKEVTPSKVFSLLDPLNYEALILFKAKYGAKSGVQKSIDNFFKYYNDVRISLTGADLARIGVIPGPRYQKIFALVLDAKLDGVVKTKEQEEELARKLAATKGKLC